MQMNPKSRRPRKTRRKANETVEIGSSIRMCTHCVTCIYDEANQMKDDTRGIRNGMDIKTSNTNNNGRGVRTCEMILCHGFNWDYRAVVFLETCRSF